jgi:hypothetical protein
MKRRLILAALAALAAMPARSQTQAWTDYRSEAGNFHVELPGTPAVNTAALPIGNNETAPATEAALRTRGATYQAVYVVYPQRISGAASADVLLDTFRNNMASGMTWRGESKLTLGRFSGREFTLVTSEKFHSAVRLYWVRGRLYQLLVTGAPGIETRADTRKFFESFALLKS